MQRHRCVHNPVAGLLHLGPKALEVAAQDGAVDALEVAPVGRGVRVVLRGTMTRSVSYTQSTAQMCESVLGGHGAGEGGEVPLRPLAHLEGSWLTELEGLEGL